jgi:hypothetical protein
VAGHESELLADMLANIALRDLTLVESLLAELEREEHKEQDPDRLEFLFRVDHLATRLRRSSENLLVLAGPGRHAAGPVAGTARRRRHLPSDR